MYIHVLIVAPEKISAPADIPWRREWRHSANSTPLYWYMLLLLRLVYNLLRQVYKAESDILNLACTERIKVGDNEDINFSAKSGSLEEGGLLNPPLRGTLLRKQSRSRVLLQCACS